MGPKERQAREVREALARGVEQRRAEVHHQPPEAQPEGGPPSSVEQVLSQPGAPLLAQIAAKAQEARDAAGKLAELIIEGQAQGISTRKMAQAAGWSKTWVIDLLRKGQPSG